MVLKVVRVGMAMALLACTSLWALAATSGSPLGGFGTGYMKYNARNGNFAAVVKVMPAASVAASEFNSWQSSSCGFHFFVTDTGKRKVTTANEDAKVPVYYADFGATRNVTFKLTAFGPFVPGSNPLYDQLAHSPIACYDIEATNGTGSSISNVAVALEFANATSGNTNILGGANTGTNDGSNAITWAGTGATGNAHMIVNCTGVNPTYSAGAIGNFLTTGILTTGAGNIVAACCDIPAASSVHYQFVVGWWNQWRNATKGNEDHWYFNLYANAKEAATAGMSNFDLIESGATSIVERVVASNFPDWFEDRLLNNLYPMVHNSVAAMDGRTGFWEGRYPIIGTIDQAEHAGLWYCFNWPQNQWRELAYWARQQRQETTYLGQIHHDFNGTTAGSWSYSNGDPNHFLYPWDNYTHQDYWFQPSTNDWGDLQCMFIFKAYELMLATADRDSLNKYWPYLKKACNRTFVQCGSAHLAASTTRSTYDDGSSTPVYCAGVQLATWLAMVEMGRWLGDDSTADRVQSWYELGRAEFAGRFYNSTFCTGTAKSEGDIAGYSWARYFGFQAIFDSNVVTTGCNRAYAYYNAQMGTRAKLGQWHFYTYDHWGGAAIGIGQQDTAMTVHAWDYSFYYTASPGYVHWQDLNSTNNSYASYMTAPCVWRSLFQMCGYLLDNANQRLWIRPMIPRVMNQVITNAPLINPRGWGTLNVNDSTRASGIDTVFQTINVSFDSLTTISSLVLKNELPAAVTPRVSNIRIFNAGSTIGEDFSVTAETNRNVYEKNLRVELWSPIQIGPNGATIEIGIWHSGITVAPYFPHRKIIKLSDSRIRAGRPIHFTVGMPGIVTLELIGMNGARVATLFKGAVPAGANSVMWSGSPGRQMIGTGIAVLRLSSPEGSVSKVMFVD